MNQMTWTALAALVIGALVRALKSDGMTIALANFNLPPIPKRALPWCAVLFGGAAAILDARIEGVEWKDAAMLGAIATATAVLGHDLGKGVPIVKKVLGVLLFVGIATNSQACKPSTAPRETARATVLVVADAVKQLDKACAGVATAKHDAALATRCADGYDVARSALIGAEDLVDAWDRGAAGDLPCTVARAVEGLQRMREALLAAGGKSPPAVDDAIRMSPLLTVGCRG